MSDEKEPRPGVSGPHDEGAVDDRPDPARPSPPDDIPLGAAIDQASLPMAVLSRSGALLRMNAAMEELFGYSRSELAALNLSELLPPDERARVSSRVTDLLEGRTGAYDVETRYVRRGGEIIWCQCTVSVLRSGRREHELFFYVLRDITARKRAEEARYAEERSYRELLSAVPGMAYRIHAGARWTMQLVSEGCFELTGHPAADLLGGRVVLRDLVHPDDLPRVAEERTRALKQRSAWSGEYRIITPSGEKWVWDRGQGVFGPSGELLYVEGLSVDVTLRKKAENALHESEARQSVLAAISPVGISRFTRDGACVYVNRRWSEIAGISPEQAMGDGWLRAVHPDDAAHVRAAWADAVEHRRAFVCEYRFLHADGTVAWALRHATPELDAAGAVVGFIGTITDITERKRSEQQIQGLNEHLERRVRERTEELAGVNETLQGEILVRRRAEEDLRRGQEALRASTEQLSRANAELARSSRLKDEFLASMSHELRTPLNAILGLSEALRENAYEPLQPEQRRAVDLIHESGRHLLSLINDILDISKIEAGKLQIASELVDLDDICRSSLRLVHAAARAKKLRVSTSLDSEVSVVPGDRRRLKQILVNLLSNAIKFTDEGGSIGLEVACDAERRFAHLTVWDTGIGMQEEDTARIFQPFVQLDNSLSRQHAGTGLGLALVRRLAELHGGGVSVESTRGVGSRFTVSLPWSGEQRSEPALQRQGDGPLLRNALVIDDSATAAQQFARYLQELGAKVEARPDGHGAVEAALAISADVVLVDVALPRSSGWSVLSALKADPRTSDIPVIMVSVEDDTGGAAAAGAADYLVKPVSREQLTQVLQKKLRRDPTEPGGATAWPGDARPLVLLAEDNEANISTVSQFLRKHGCRLVIARTGSEAVELARELSPACILMDIQLPGMDGLEATRRIRAEPRIAGIPIIALTALAMPGDRERCIASGANEYMSKPVSLKELIRSIRAQVLGGSRAAETAASGPRSTPPLD